MNLRQAAEMALEACEHLNRTGDTQVFDLCYADKVIPALRQALAQPKREWAGLTDEEVKYLISHFDWRAPAEHFVSAIESKLKEKNT